MVPSAMIFDLYTQFLVDAIVKRGEDQSLCLSSQNVDLTSHLLLVYEKAETMGCITEDLACQHVSFYLRLGRVDEARKLAEKLCNGKLADATQLWLLRVSIEMRCIAGESFSLSKADLLCVFELLRKVLTKGSIFAAESLWLMVCDRLFHVDPLSLVNLQIAKIYIISIIQHPPFDVLCSLFWHCE